jgi:hypothetical protein
MQGDCSPAPHPALFLHHTLPLPLHHIFWIAAALVVVGQVMILRSTVRAMRAASSERARRGIEWAYAVGPVVLLLLVLLATRQASLDYAARLQLEAQAGRTHGP